MLILRTLGVLLVVLGFAALAYDGAIMLASPGSVAWTSLQQHWTQVSALGVENAQAHVQKLGIPGLWSLFSWLLALPAWASLGGVGAIFCLLGRRRQRPAAAE